MTGPILAVDVGATNVRAAIVDPSGNVDVRREAATPTGVPGDGIVDGLVALLRLVAAEAPQAPSVVSIASAGLVDAVEGRVVISPNAPGFRNLAITAPVSDALGIPCYLENDASAAALGEHRFGAGRGFDHLIHVTVGTGIGGGLVLDGRLYRGARGFAGEIGHMVIDTAGPPCNCGSRGCLEAMASGTAFATRVRSLLASGRSPLLASIVGSDEPAGEHLHRAALQGDPICEAEIRHAGHILGIGIGSLVNILNPQAITISGGLLVLGDMYFGPMRDALASFAYAPSSGVSVLLSALGDDAGLLGAAAVALERMA